jgi:hypothetical protein
VDVGKQAAGTCETTRSSFKEDAFLLVAEGDFDTAICAAETYLSTETEEKSTN